MGSIGQIQEAVTEVNATLQLQGMQHIGHATDSRVMV